MFFKKLLISTFRRLKVVNNQTQHQFFSHFSFIVLILSNTERDGADKTENQGGAHEDRAEADNETAREMIEIRHHAVLLDRSLFNILLEEE